MGPCLNLEALSPGTILACCSLPTTTLDGLVIAFAHIFLSPTATLLEPGSNMQYVGAHCTLAGNCVQSEGSATRLSLIPWLLSLVLPFIVVVEKGGKVIGLVVLIKYLLSGCACTSHLD